MFSLQQLPSCTGMWWPQDPLWAASTDNQRKCFRTYNVGTWNAGYWLEVSAGYSVIVVVVFVNQFCSFIMRSRTFDLAFEKSFLPFSSASKWQLFETFSFRAGGRRVAWQRSYCKRGLNICFPFVRGCNFAQKIFWLWRIISGNISFGTFFTFLQEPQFHSSVRRYREHLQKTPGISITAGKTIQNVFSVTRSETETLC